MRSADRAETERLDNTNTPEIDYIRPQSFAIEPERKTVCWNGGRDVELGASRPPKKEPDVSGSAIDVFGA